MLLTRGEFEHHGCTRIELTSRDLTWDPLTDIYEDQENTMIYFQGDIVRSGIIDRAENIPLEIYHRVFLVLIDIRQRIPS